MEKYYCTKCKRNHYRGKIYQKHLSYKKKNESKLSSKGKMTSLDFEKLRPIAQRQIRRLLERMEYTKNIELYKNEIKKVINNELSR